jgi:hypothetical protein
MNKEALENALPKLYPDRIDYVSVKAWIDDCDSNVGSEPTRRTSSHRKCKGIVQSTFNSFKVIDCRNMRLVPAPIGRDYVAVSYVWGQSSVGHSENSTLLHDPPLSLRDSIEVVLSLGYDYIWIDRYVCTTLEDIRSIR